MAADYNLYWGDMHTQCASHLATANVFDPSVKKQPSWGEWGDRVERTFQEATRYVNFFGFAYYPGFNYRKSGLLLESVGDRPEYQKEWKWVQTLVKRHDHPGHFITFLGYEWIGDRRTWGDHNVFYLDDDQPLDQSFHIDDLFANLRKRKAIAIPHHTGYQVGERGKDWNHHDEGLSPFAEVYSGHGSSEGCGTPLPMDLNEMSPRVSGGTVQDGLMRGYRLGMIASCDSSVPAYGRGVMACYAKELTREALWDAFISRRVYGVTGDRMQIRFFVNDHFMGEVFKSRGPARIRAEVVGLAPLDRIEVIRNNRVIHTHCHNGSWEAPAAGRTKVKMRVEHGWGLVDYYGLKVSDKVWDGSLGTDNARIVSVEGCFNRRGQTIGSVSAKECSYQLTTSPRGLRPTGASQQSIVFEIDGPLDGKVNLKVNGISETLTLHEAMQKTRCIGMLGEVKKVVEEQVGLREADVENPDVYWQNAYKVKIFKAVPEAGYRTEIEFEDDNPPAGRNFYYLRVSQVNGQYAWTSPIWVENVVS